MIAYLEFNNLERSEAAASSDESKEILQLIKNQELKIQLAISAGLTCPIRELLTNLTEITTRRCLSDNFDALRTRIQRLESRELNIRDLIESISAGDEDAMQGRDLFLENYEDNPDILRRTQEIYLHVVGQMMPFLESFEQVNEERGDETVDLTNVSCERVFGVLKFAEKALPNLKFGVLAQYTMAKLNQFHSEISEIERRMKQGIS